MDIWQARYSDPACIDRSKSNRLEKRHKRSNQVMLEVVSLSQLVLYLFKVRAKALVTRRHFKSIDVIVNATLFFYISE